MNKFRTCALPRSNNEDNNLYLLGFDENLSAIFTESNQKEPKIVKIEEKQNFELFECADCGNRPIGSAVKKSHDQLFVEC